MPERPSVAPLGIGAACLNEAPRITQVCVAIRFRQQTAILLLSARLCRVRMCVSLQAAQCMEERPHP